jgi:hypothetical protein
LKERFRSSLDAFKQRFVLTREETRVTIFIGLAIVLGVTARHYRHAYSPTPDKIDKQHSYARAQNAPTARSASARPRKKKGDVRKSPGEVASAPD